MSRFFITFDGAAEDAAGVEYGSADEARNAAIVRLGAYLQEHPEYAYQQHWRVDIRDHARRLISHVIIATVVAAPPINWESLERQPDNYRQGRRPD